MINCRRFTILGFWLEIALLGQAFCQETPRQLAIRAFQKALGDFIANNDVTKAAQGFTAASKLDPTYAQPYFNLAVLAEGQEDWTTAQQDLEKYLQFNPNSPMKDQIEIQIENLKALADNDKDPAKKAKRQYASLVENAKVLYDQRNYKGALELAQDAQNKDSGRWEAYAIAARVHFSLKQYRDAADSLRTAAGKAPAEQQAKLLEIAKYADNEAEYQDLCRTAATQLAQGQQSAAAALLTSAWKLFPDRTNTGFDAAANAILAKDYNGARSILQELAKKPDAAPRAASMLTQVNVLVTGASNPSAESNASPSGPSTNNQSDARKFAGEVKSAGNGKAAPIACTVELDPSGTSGTITFGSQLGDTTVRFSGERQGDKLSAKTGDVVSKPARIKWDAETFTLVFSNDGASAVYTCTLSGSDLSGKLSSR
jgi:tetratricopeptide (TPR) repeat protein